MKLFKILGRKKKKRTISGATLEPKRHPIRGRRFQKLHARSKRRQRAATTGELEGTVPNIGVARALVIILCLHVAAIAGIFVHNRYFDKSKDQSDASVAEKVDPVKSPIANHESIPANPAADDLAYVVVAGDDYSKIAKHYGVDEQELRVANFSVKLRPGRILRIPPSRSITLKQTELAAGPGNAGTSDAGSPTDATVALLVKPNPPRAHVVGPVSTSGQYVVQPGDSVWRLAQRFNVSQDELMEVNGIDDPRKLGVGMNLKIPGHQ